MLSSHNLNSSTENNSRVNNAFGNRVLKENLYLPVHQSVGIEAKSETLVINSSTQPMWGSSHMFNISEKNVVYNGCTLRLELPPVTGQGAYIPGQFMVDRINVVINGQVFDIIVDLENFLRLQLYSTDADRLSSNLASGLYTSQALRVLLSSTTTNNVILIPLKCALFDVIQPAILNDQHSIQLNVFMNSQAQSIDAITGVITANNNIISSSLIMKVTRLSPSDAYQRLSMMSRRKFDTIFHSVVPTTFSANIGASSSTFILSNLMNQNVMQLLICVRASKQGVQQFNFTRINTLNILDGASNSLSGGPLNSSYYNNLSNRDNTVSSYNTETFFNTTNNNAHFYIHSFSIDPVGSLKNGLLYGSRSMQGNESIVINYLVPLTTNVVIDVFAYCENVIQQGVGGYSKI